jgi:electron transfer flavoprotein alpha subunit
VIEAKRMRRETLPVALQVSAEVALREFTTDGYLAGLNTRLDIVPWPKAVPVSGSAWVVDGVAERRGEEPMAAKTVLDVDEAADLLRQQLGVGSEGPEPDLVSIGNIVPVSEPSLLCDVRTVTVLASDSQGRLTEGARAVLTADPQAGVLILVPPDSLAQQAAAGQAVRLGASRIVLLEVPKEALLVPAWKQRIVEEAWTAIGLRPQIVFGESWLEPLWPRLACRLDNNGCVVLRVSRLQRTSDGLVAATRRGKLAVERRLSPEPGRTAWMTLLPEAETEAPPASPGSVEVQRWIAATTTLFTKETVADMLARVREEIGTPQLKDADFIIDVGFGIGSRDGYEAVIVPLERALRSLGVTQIAVGGSRKVTEELRVLPVDRQIGQSGVSVRPRILLAVGISGAPQHLSYIDPRATIIAFNRDPEAPIMTLNRRQARPRVFGVVGDLFETVPAFIAALKPVLPSESRSDPIPAPGEKVLSGNPVPAP